MLHKTKLRLKICGGFCTTKGADFFCRIRGHLSTMLKQSRHALCIFDTSEWANALPDTMHLNGYFGTILKSLYLSILALLLILIAGGCSQISAKAHKAQQVQGFLYCTFDVSPDGRSIAFSGAGNGGKDLYLLNLATDKVVRLTDTPNYENYPAFSPDGNSIVYQCAKDLGSPRYLFLRSLDGKHTRQLTHSTLTSDSRPSFSRTGEQIVFCRSHRFLARARGENTWDDQDVYVINRDGTGLRRVTKIDSDAVMDPKFYPDNRYILFERDIIIYDKSQWHLPVDSQTHLYKADSRGKHLIQEVTHFSNFADFSPSFYPDGQRIVFCANFGGQVDLYQMSLAGGQPTPLLSDRKGSELCDPVVTHDGKIIHCMKSDTGGLWEMNSDGSNLHQIASNDLFSDPMHWNP